MRREKKAIQFNSETFDCCEGKEGQELFLHKIQYHSNLQPQQYQLPKTNPRKSFSTRMKIPTLPPLIQELKEYIPTLFVFNTYVEGIDTIIECSFDSPNTQQLLDILEEVFEDWEVIRHDDSLEIYYEYCRIIFYKKFMKNETIVWEYYQYVSSQDEKIETLRSNIVEILLQTELKDCIHVAQYLILHFLLNHKLMTNIFNRECQHSKENNSIDINNQFNGYCKFNPSARWLTCSQCNETFFKDMKEKDHLELDVDFLKYYILFDFKNQSLNPMLDTKEKKRTRDPLFTYLPFDKDHNITKKATQNGIQQMIDGFATELFGFYNQLPMKKSQTLVYTNIADEMDIEDIYDLLEPFDKEYQLLWCDGRENTDEKAFCIVKFSSRNVQREAFKDFETLDNTFGLKCSIFVDEVFNFSHPRLFYLVPGKKVTIKGSHSYHQQNVNEKVRTDKHQNDFVPLNNTAKKEKQNVKKPMTQETLKQQNQSQQNQQQKPVIKPMTQETLKQQNQRGGRQNNNYNHNEENQRGNRGGRGRGNNRGNNNYRGGRGGYNDYYAPSESTYQPEIKETSRQNKPYRGRGRGRGGKNMN